MTERLFEQAADQLRQLLLDPLDKKGKSYFVDRGKGRRLVITDLHGCYQTFVKLLDKIELKRKDQLFILGDLLDRAPYSQWVIEHVVRLLAEGYQIYPLRGNHEQLFIDLDKSNRSKLTSFALRQNSLHLLDKEGNLNSPVNVFLRMFPYFYELDNYFLVHAGFDSTAKNPLKEWSDMLWIRDFRYDAELYKRKTVVHGHVPVPLSTIRRAIRSRAKEICLDNGCVRAEVFDFGKMVCMDLDTLELVTQKNIDLVPA